MITNTPPESKIHFSPALSFIKLIFTLIVFFALQFPVIAAAIPPANDDFASSVLISGISGSVTESNIEATKETGEPWHAGNPGGSSVWWHWVAPFAEQVTIDTSGSDFDTTLGVYTGTSVNGLTEIASNDDATGLGTKSAVSFTAVAGTTYRIAVDGFNGVSGSITLNWLQAFIPANDDFANSIVVTGTPGTTTGLSSNSTKEVGEPFHAADPGGHSVWWQWTPLTSGSVGIDTFGSNFDTLLAVYTGISVDSLTEIVSNDDTGGNQSQVTFTAVAGTTYHIAVDGFNVETGSIKLNWVEGIPTNDDFVNSILIAGTTGTTTGSNYFSTKETGEPSHAGFLGGSSVWWQWTPLTTGPVGIDLLGSDFNPLLAVYTGTSVNGLTEIASSSASPNLVIFTAVAGTTYHIAVDGLSAIPGIAIPGIITLNWWPVIPPANDDFANSILIAGTSGTTTGTNVFATKETGEPNHAGFLGGSSVWWDWVAPASELVTIDTLGSDFDTLLAVYTGTGVSGLTEIASNDQEPGGGNQSQVTFTTVAGTTYRIAVDGFGVEIGSITLNWVLTITVPDVTGLTEAVATTNIVNAGLILGTVTPQSSTTVAAGLVISQNPLGGTSAAPGSAVNLVVSTGALVPDVVGQTEAVATTNITNAGLILGTVTPQSSTTVAAGLVISQNPLGGTSATPGSAVNIVVSTGASVPDVAGLTEAVATTNIVNAGLILGTVTPQSSTTVAAGLVISQNPLGGTSAAPGSAVNIVVSTGASVPDVTGLTEAVATTNITNAGLILGTVTPQSSTTVAAGLVISQNPLGGTSAAPGSAVNLVVSTGALVPDVVGQTEAVATTNITNAGLILGTVTPQSSTTVAAGLVISQNPLGGTSATPGSAVNIVVSTGASVPDVAGLTEAVATTNIVNAGLILGTVTPQSSTTVAAGLVISQNPLGGTSAAPGSAVNIVVSTGASVPDVTGLTEAVATTNITNAGLILGTVTPQSSTTVAAGLVISQNPLGGTSAAPGSAVNIVVSTGASVPDVAGLTEAVATTNIVNAGLILGTVTPQSSTTVAAGLVISQNPLGGTSAAPGSAVNLVVSTGALVPDVVGQTEAVATTNITNAGLILGTVTPQSSTTVAAGLVISQNPLGGTSAAPGSAVNLVVSTGALVPDVVGQTEAVATTNITNAGLILGTVTPQSSTTVAAGLVISQNPLGGTSAAPGSAVNLVVSTGASVPDVTGLTEAVATANIVNAGLILGTVTPQSSTTVAAGLVISQNPLSGTSATPGSAVNLVVSTGALVPDVVGQTEAVATTNIVNAGLILGTVTPQSSTTVAAGLVISQNPLGGTSAAPGSAVNIVVSTGASVPDVAGLTEAVATTNIVNAGLILGTVTPQSSTTVAAGLVISQNPLGGTSATPGSAVNIVVSTGASVPDVAGLTEAVATANIVNAGLILGTVTPQSSTTVAAGLVISQNPLGGTSAAPGSAVNLVVSTGALVPDVVGQTEAVATTNITNAGLILGTVTPQSSTTVAAGLVISQNPLGGTSAAPGSAVNLVVSTGASVPDVTGLTEAVATANIVNAGLILGTVTPQSSTTVAAGLVISQNPLGGTSAAPGSAVNLVVSTGALVPDVVGQTEAVATTNIVNAGLILGTVTPQSSTTVAAGLVISQNPLGGTSATPGSAVNIVVSTGASVPDVAGLTEAVATTNIVNAGLILGTVTPQSSTTVAAGLVISQNPLGGTSAAPGSAVNLVVSTGALVPDVVGQTEAVATTNITNAGLILGTVTPQSSTTVAAGLVISQNPLGGTSAAPGSAVNLVISTGPIPENDNFASSILILGGSDTTTGSNANATKETGEPNHAGDAGGSSVWWHWVAPVSEMVTMDTFGSDFDTLLAVYTGASVGALTETASNDQEPGGQDQSQVTFEAVAGTTYHIAVDGFNGASGSIALNLITELPNDVVLNIPGSGVSIIFNDNSSSSVLHADTATAIAVGDLDNNGEDDVIVSFPAGTGPDLNGGTYISRNQGALTLLTLATAERIVAGNFDGIGGDDLLVDFGLDGLWSYLNDSTGSQLTPESPLTMKVGDVDNSGQDDVILSFTAFGTVLFTNFTTAIVLEATPAEVLELADIDGNGEDDIVASYAVGNGPGATGGIFIARNQGALSLLTTMTAELITRGDFDGGGLDDLLFDLGSVNGLWVYLNDATAQQLTLLSPEAMSAGDVDSSGQDDMFVSFTGLGTHVYKNMTTLETLDPVGVATHFATGNVDGN